jgi:hypothetical protein
MAEAWVSAIHASMQHEAAADGQPVQPDGDMPAAPALVSKCQAADIGGLAPTELLQMVAWAAASPRGTATPCALAAAAAGAPLVETRGSEAVAPPQLPHLLAALRARLLSGAVDGAWLQATYAPWRESLMGLMADSRAARLAAPAQGEEAGSGGEGPEIATGTGEVSEGSTSGCGSGAGGDGVSDRGSACGGSYSSGASTAAPEDVSPRLTAHRGGGRQAVETLLGAAAEWCLSGRRVTTGTMSLLRQVCSPLYVGVSGARLPVAGMGVVRNRMLCRRQRTRQRVHTLRQGAS